MSTNETTTTGKSLPLAETLASRAVVVRRTINVTLPDIFPEEINLDALRDRVMTANPTATVETVDRWIAHLALSTLLINFRGAVEVRYKSELAKLAGENEPTPEHEAKARVRAQKSGPETTDWSAWCPSLETRATTSPEDRAAKEFARLFGKLTPAQLEAALAKFKAQSQGK